MSEANKQLIQRWFEEVWNKGRPDAIDEMIAEDCVIHGLGEATGQSVTGPSEFKTFHATFREAFPDITVSVDDTVAEGDKVAARCSVYGKHTGDSLGFKASQSPVEFTGITIVRVREGRIAEAWNNFDFMKLYKQIGVI